MDGRIFGTGAKRSWKCPICSRDQNCRVNRKKRRLVLTENERLRHFTTSQCLTSTGHYFLLCYHRAESNHHSSLPNKVHLSDTALFSSH